MINIQLNYNNGYKWHSLNGIYVKGYIFDEKNNLFSEKNLIDYFYNVNNKDEFIEKLINANGIFSVIIIKENITYIAVDRTRTFPLLYSSIIKKFILSDNIEYLQQYHDGELDKINIEEFLQTGFVTGNETLYKDIYQVQAGEYIIFKDSSLERNFYFDYSTTFVTGDDYKTLKNTFINILENTAKRLIKVAKGRQIVVPLSGGYDSRLIVALLKKYAYDNVICFTYGSAQSFEVKISKDIAQILNYKWYFIEYNNQTVKSDYPQTSDFLAFAKFASNGISISHAQDYFAVEYLKKNALIEEGSLFVPGHSGDFLGGSHLREAKKHSYSSLVENIFKKHYNLNHNIHEKIFKKKIKNQLSQLTSNIENVPSSVEDAYNLKERQSKFIVNANRVYEYFGYHHCIPLWDNELIEFFKILPLQYKVELCLYDEVLLHSIFSEQHIDIKKTEKLSYLRKIARFKIFKNELFTKLKKIIAKYFFRDDINKKSLRITPLLNDINQDINYWEGNTINALWHIKKYQEKWK